MKIWVKELGFDPKAAIAFGYSTPCVSKELAESCCGCITIVVNCDGQIEVIVTQKCCHFKGCEWHTPQEKIFTVIHFFFVPSPLFSLNTFLPDGILANVSFYRMIFVLCWVSLYSRLRDDIIQTHWWLTIVILLLKVIIWQSKSILLQFTLELSLFFSFFFGFIFLPEKFLSFLIGCGK